MKMKKTMLKMLTLALAAVLLLGTVPALLGCASSEASDMAIVDEAPAMDMEYDFDYSTSYDGDYSTGNVAAEEKPAEESESQSQPDGAVERKIIRNANVSIEAEDARACYASVLEYVKSLGGYESNYNERSNEYSSGTYIDIEVEFRIAPEKLEEFVGRTGEFGEVTYCAVTSDEVTAEYYDLATRLESKTRALDSYYALFEKAETIDDILTIQYRIDELTEEIESIKGRIRLYDSLVDESTIYLSISQYTSAPVAEKEFEWDSLTGSDFLKLIKNGFLGVCNFVWSALQWFVIILISVLPLLVIAAGVFFAVRAVRKKLGKTGKKTAKESAANADTGDTTTPPTYM